MINQPIKRTERHTGRIAPSYPDVEKTDQELSQLTQIEPKIHFMLFCRTTGKRRIDLEIAKPEFLCEIPVEIFRPRFQAGLMEDRNDSNLNPRSFRLEKPLGPEFGVCFCSAPKQFAVHVGVVHRGTNRAAKHSVDYVVPRVRVTDKIGLQIVGKP